MQCTAELRRIAGREAETNRKAALDFLANRPKEASPRLNWPLPLIPPNEDTIVRLDRLEALIGLLPFAVRAWYKQVGSISLLGWHTALRPNPDEPGGLAGDSGSPFMIFPLAEMADDAESSFEAIPEGEEIEIYLYLAPDPAEPIVPDEAADAPFYCYGSGTNEMFVEYLRRSFQWGGFPGWARSKSPPMTEIETLREGLLAI